jgi:hypothetical protein
MKNVPPRCAFVMALLFLLSACSHFSARGVHIENGSSSGDAVSLGFSTASQPRPISAVDFKKAQAEARTGTR